MRQDDLGHVPRDGNAAQSSPLIHPEQEQCRRCAPREADRNLPRPSFGSAGVNIRHSTRSVGSPTASACPAARPLAVSPRGCSAALRSVKVKRSFFPFCPSDPDRQWSRRNPWRLRRPPAPKTFQSRFAEKLCGPSIAPLPNSPIRSSMPGRKKIVRGYRGGRATTGRSSQ